MGKYLDGNGLSHLCGIVKAYVDSVVQAAGAITGVKGDAESAYRTGNVNLTPANIGAVAVSGGTMTGDLNMDTSAVNILHEGINIDSGYINMGDSPVLMTDSSVDMATAPSSSIYDRVVEIYDANGNSIGWLQVAQTSNWHSICLGASNSDDSAQNQLWLGYDGNDSPIAWASEPAAIRNALGASSGIWPASVGGTGISNIGTRTSKTAGTDSPSGNPTANSWFRHTSFTIPAGKGMLFLRGCASSGGSGYVWMSVGTSDAADLNSSSPDYQTASISRPFQYCTTNQHVNLGVAYPYDLSEDTTYYVCFKVPSTSGKGRWSSGHIVPIASA